jgi:capsid protein
MMEIDAGFTTATDVMAQHGREFDDVVDRRAQELARLKKADIPIARSTNTRDPLPAGQVPGQVPAVGNPASPAKTPTKAAAASQDGEEPDDTNEPGTNDQIDDQDDSVSDQE